MRDLLTLKSIQGIDELKIDVNKAKPRMQVVVDREKAGELGVSAGQVGQQLRNSIFGAKSWSLQRRWGRLRYLCSF